MSQKQHFASQATLFQKEINRLKHLQNRNFEVLNHNFNFQLKTAKMNVPLFYFKLYVFVSFFHYFSSLL